MIQDDIPPADDVTVVIPFYNRSFFARRLLESVARQTCRPSAVLFVDNGSIAAEVEALQQIISSTNVGDLDVRYVASQRTGNANIARNLGMLSANTRYVAFLDSDDWWEPNHLQASLKVLQDAGRTGVYSGSIVHSNGAHKNRSVDIDSLPTAFHLLFSREGWSAQTSTYVIDRTLLRGITWDERLQRHQDYDFFITVALNSNGWAFNPEPTGNLERNAAGSGRNFDFKSMIRFLRKWQSQFPQECMHTYLLSQLDACIISESPDRYFRYYRSLYLSCNDPEPASRLRSHRLYRENRIRLINMTKRFKIYSLLKKVRSRT